MADDIFNVSSFNQLGGITAGQVNIGAQQRHLTNEKGEQLIKMLNQDNKEVKIVCQPGDESLNYANEMRQFLEKNGFEVNIVPVLYDNPPQRGVGVNPGKNEIEIY